MLNDNSESLISGEDYDREDPSDNYQQDNSNDPSGKVKIIGSKS